MTVTARSAGSAAKAARACSAPSHVPTGIAPGSGVAVLPTATNRWSKSTAVPSSRVTVPSPILSAPATRVAMAGASMSASGVAAVPVPASCSCSRTRSTKSGRGLTTVIRASGAFFASRFAATVPAYPAPITTMSIVCLLPGKIWVGYGMRERPCL